MTGESYRFGGYLLDSKQLILLRGNEILRLPPKVVETLLVLVDARGRLVGKDELMGRVWPDAFVEEANVARNIYLLRRTLGKRPDGGEYIETLARRGYRFTAQVDLVACGNDAASTAAGSEPSETRPVATPKSIELKGPNGKPHKPKSRRLEFLAGVIVALVVILLVSSRETPRPSFPLKQGPLTFNSSLLPVSSVALSPDGRYLAYADSTGIHVRNIASGAITALPAPPGIPQLTVDCWYPDGSAVLATAGSPNPAQRSLWKLPVIGLARPETVHQNVDAASISPDGKIIAFTTGDRRTVGLIPAQGGGERVILTAAVGAHFTGLSWFPGSEWLAVIRQPSNVYFSTIEAVDAKTRRVTPINPQGRVTSLVALPSHRIVFSKVGPAPFGYTNMWSMRIDLRTGRPLRQPRQITQWAATDVHTLSASASGGRLALVKVKSNKFVAAGILAERDTKLEDVQRITLDDRNDYPHGWASGSRAILFESDRAGPWKIYEQVLGRPAAELVTLADGDENYPRMSPDGRWILYVHSPSVWDIRQSASLMRLPISGGAPRKVASVSGFDDYRCARGPRQGCIVDEAQHGLLVFYRLDPIMGIGGKVLEIREPRPQSIDWDVSPDGAQVALVDSEAPNGVIRVFSLPDRRETDIRVKGWTRLRSIAWQANGKGWFVGAPLGERAALLEVDLQGQPHVLWNSPNSFVPYAVPSPDGRRLAFPEYSATDQAWTLENF